MQRREFLTASAASAALLAAGSTGSAATVVLPAAGAAGFNRARFRSWLNDEFQVTAWGSLRRSRATLAAVDDGPSHAGLEQFSIVFRGSAPLPAGLCWVSHPDAQFVLHLHGAVGGMQRRAHFSLLEARHV
ncbi:MAG: DUF6916 family protein [Steroidobacteraceae bacterium]